MDNSHDSNKPVAWMTKDGEIYKHDCWPEHEARPLVFGDAPQPAQQEPLATFKDEVIGCFNAAFVEGLQEALAETQDERLKDLVERRLMHALYAAQEIEGKK